MDAPSSNPFATPEKLQTHVLKINHQLNIARGLCLSAVRVVATKELLAMSIRRSKLTPIPISARKYHDDLMTLGWKSRSKDIIEGVHYKGKPSVGEKV